MYDTTARAEAGIEASGAELLRNPYLLYECDRRAADPIAFGGVDRGLFPDEAVREQFALPERSRIEDPADDRRVRAVVVDLLEHAAAEGTRCSRGVGSSAGPGSARSSRRARSARTCSTPARRASRPSSRARQPARASLPTKWTGSSSAVRLSAARCSAERGASRTRPISTGEGSWTRGSMSGCLRIQKSAGWRSARGARRRRRSSSSSARGSPC